MGLGIREDNRLEHVPGTSPLQNLGQEDLDTGIGNLSILKYDDAAGVILVPQPSDSPDDPYNWPRWKKHMFTVAIAYGCGVVGAVGPLLTSTLVPLAEQFEMPLQTFTLGLQGSCTGAVALGSLICNIAAIKIGKRPIYIISAIGLVATCFWAAAATSFRSLAAARAVQGLCMAPLEALVPASLADIWFVHERGFRSAIYNLGVLGGINLASPIAGSIIQYGSYQTCLRAMGGAFVVHLILTIFFMPETSYKRSGVINIDTDAKEAVTRQEIDEKEAHSPSPNEVVHAFSDVKPSRTTSYLHSLLPYNGYYDSTPLWLLTLRPFAMLSSPIVCWATLMLISFVWWVVLISITLSQIFTQPPYNFSVSAVGATSVSAFVASTIGTFVASPGVDGVVKLMSKKNEGTFEPEFRLPVVVVYLLCTCTAGFGFGESLSLEEPWEVPVIVCMGLINLGVVLGITATTAYVCDSHRKSSAEAFAVMNFIKNMFAFGLAFYSNDWLERQGYRTCFFVIAGISTGITLLTVPMYVFGKNARSFAARHEWLKF